MTTARAPTAITATLVTACVRVKSRAPGTIAVSTFPKGSRVKAAMNGPRRPWRSAARAKASPRSEAKRVVVNTQNIPPSESSRAVRE
jgi:hypothetical protein